MRYMITFKRADGTNLPLIAHDADNEHDALWQIATQRKYFDIRDYVSYRITELPRYDAVPEWGVSS